MELVPSQEKSEGKKVCQAPLQHIRPKQGEDEAEQGATIPANRPSLVGVCPLPLFPSTLSRIGYLTFMQ